MVSRDNKQVYVANYATNDITVIDATLNSVSATIPLPANSNPFGLAQTLVSSKLYVTGWSSNAVYVVDTARKAVTATIPVGVRPVSVAVTPDASRVYVSNYNGSASITSVSVIDAASNTVLTDIPLPSGVAPSGVSVHPDGDWVYVASYSTGVVFVIDAASNTIVNTVTVGTRPYAFGSFISLPQPTLSLVAPANSLINNSVPTFIFSYGTECNGNPCQISNNYFSTFDLKAQLNNQSIGSLTTFSPTSSFVGQPGGSASYTPASRLPEGPNSLNAQAQDRFGRFTSPLTAAFSVDTIAPNFLTLRPASGGVYLNPAVTVSGSIDDPTASIYSSSMQAGFFSNQRGPNFTFPTTLAPGLNNINLSTIDLAGNSTKTSLNLTYTPFTLYVSSPQNNDSIYSNQVTVSGYFSGASNASVSVNGIAASVNGVNFTAANVPLVSGTNTLLVTGTRADDGKVQTQQFSVFSYAPSIAITAPLNGATFTGNSALVTGTFTGLVAAVTVNGVTATLSGNNFSALVPLVFGNNTLVATATTAAAVTVIRLSAAQTVNVTSSAPSITITSPTANATLNTATVAVSGTFNGPSNTSITVNGVAAAITNNTFSATVPVRYGANTLTATLATGAMTVSTAMAVIGTLPSISITAPTANATIAASSVTVSGTFQASIGATVSVNGVAATVTGNTYTAANVPLIYGSNTLTVTVTAPDNSTASAAVTVTSTTPTLTITGPADGASINGDSILVSGTLLDPINTGVTVNGVVANVDNGKFYANNVPLQPGANTLTVIYTLADGTAATQTRSVDSTGTNPLQVTADAYTGAAPLSVNLAVTSQTGSPIQTIGVDPGGNGSVGSITASGLDGSVSLTYPAPGTYIVNVTITDALGSHSQAVAITVWDPAQMDSFFNAVWTGVNNALIAGDKAKALTYLNASAQAKYGPVFDALLPSMPFIIESYSPLQRLQVYPNIGEYAVNRTIHGMNRIYLIYFLLDNDGVWRIDSM